MQIENLWAQSYWTPWPYLLLVGLKTGENRKSKIWPKRLGQWTLVHNTKRKPPKQLLGQVERFIDPMKLPEWSKRGTGAIVGAVRYVECLTSKAAKADPKHRPWVGDAGHYYVVGERVQFKEEEFIPVKGKQSLFWQVDDETSAAATALLRKAGVKL